MMLRKLTLLAILLGAPQLSFAQGQYIDLFPKTGTDLQLILDTLSHGVSEFPEDASPIVMMLHGPEAHRFLKNSFSDNRDVIDQTAQLVAYGILDVKICATWMRMNGYTDADLLPFVMTVPFGEAELERLTSEEGYAEYSVDL